MSRRQAKVELDLQNLATAMLGGAGMNMIPPGLPESATYIRSHIDHDGTILSMVFSDDSFEELPSGRMIPTLFFEGEVIDLEIGEKELEMAGSEEEA